MADIAHNLDLREPNRQALEELAKALDDAPDGAEFIADLATGVGKTYIAGGLLDYLFESGVRNVVIVTPGSTIQRKTIDNLTPGHPKYVRGMQSRPMVITLDTFERGEVGIALADESRFKVFVLTVQSLLRPNKEDRRRAYQPHETVGQGLHSYLEARDDLVVIADEHHVYFSGNARKFEGAIGSLHPLAMIGLTATPHPSAPGKKVYRYPLADAIADGYVKIPVLVSRQDGISDLRTQMSDGLTLLDAKREAMQAYCAQAADRTYVEPVLFVVASTIEEATEYRDMLAGPDMLGSRDQVLLITSEEPDETLEALDGLEDSSSPVRAVVSVSMLKEGWDVKNIYVISSVRSMESQLLTEQILGRGLRLPFGRRTGNSMLDTVEVLSHRSFTALLKQAKALLEETLGDRLDEATIVTNPLPGLRKLGIPAAQPELDIPGQGTQEVQILLPGPARADPTAVSLFSDDEERDLEAPIQHVGFGFSTVGARVQAAAEATRTLALTFSARSINGVRLPLFLPQVTTRWERDKFSLANVNLISVESLGRQFQHDNAPTLMRKAMDARRDGGDHAHIVITDQTEEVRASQLLMDFDTIETDLVKRLLRTNAVEATVQEMNAAVDVARAFLEGAGVTEETPWRQEHGRLATARLTEWIAGLQTSSPAREVRDVKHVRWPEQILRTETRPPADRHIVTSSRDFERGYPYSGWNKSVYEICDFDAYSTEFLLASLFERSAPIRAWARVDQTVPLRIAYFSGAIQRMYEPDFIVIDEAGTYWIVEGKRNDEMTNPIVLAKRDAAAAWIQTVNASAIVHEKWGYVLASEAVVASASTWDDVRLGAQTYN